MNTPTRAEIVWADGTIRPIRDTRLSLYNTGFIHGDCVTEMLRTFRHQPFRVTEHLARFRHSVNAALLECSWDDAELAGAIESVVSQNCSLIDPHADLGIILFATGGPNLTYVGKAASATDVDFGPITCVHTFPLHFELWRGALQSGQHLVLAPLTSLPPECMDPTIKTRSRMHWRIADRLVKRDHPGANAIFADAAGNLTETSSANLFVLKEGELLTPPSDLVLNGISRQVVMELASAAGYAVKEQAIPIQLALDADEIWTSSTPYCVLPVTRFNDTTISTGKPGPVFFQILNAWSDLVGMDLSAQMQSDV